MSTGDNPAWRAYALMIWPTIKSFGNSVPITDENGEPVLDERGEPKTRWVGFNLHDMTSRAIQQADALYAAELEAESRYLSDKLEGEKDTNDGD